MRVAYEKNIGKIVESLLWNTILLMVFSAAIGTGITGTVLSARHEKKMKSLEAENEALKAGYVLQNRNTIGGDANDSFYETNYGRAYLAIDGKPVEEYFSR